MNKVDAAKRIEFIMRKVFKNPEFAIRVSTAVPTGVIKTSFTQTSALVDANEKPISDLPALWVMNEVTAAGLLAVASQSVKVIRKTNNRKQMAKASRKQRRK